MRANSRDVATDHRAGNTGFYPGLGDCIQGSPAQWIESLDCLLLGESHGLPHLDGSLYQRIQDVPGKNDHREDKERARNDQYGPAHSITLTEGGLLAGLAGATEIEVNSLHSQGIDRLGDGLTMEAIAPDGIIEAVTVKNAAAFALAVQWHPEWRVAENPFSLAMFEAFGRAVKARAAARSSRERVARTLAS